MIDHYIIKAVSPRVTAPSKGTGTSAIVTACIHHLVGNQHPHFSITAEGGQWGQKAFSNASYFGGCMHDLALTLFPKLSTIIPLHLSDYPSGKPSHAAANGLYHLGLTEYADALNLTRAASHWRISEVQAQALRDDWLSLSKELRRAACAVWCADQAARWEAEAKEARNAISDLSHDGWHVIEPT